MDVFFLSFFREQANIKLFCQYFHQSNLVIQRFWKQRKGQEQWSIPFPLQCSSTTVWVNDLKFTWFQFSEHMRAPSWASSFTKKQSYHKTALIQRTKRKKRRTILKKNCYSYKISRLLQGFPIVSSMLKNCILYLRNQHCFYSSFSAQWCF